jgi:hypothetical protein
MYRNLFTAWYCLGVLALCLGAFLILWPFVGADRARGGFGLWGLLGLLPFFWYGVFRKEKSDERDISFLQRAAFIGLVNGFVTIIFLNTLLAFIYQFRFGFDSIPIDVFWLPSAGGLLVGVLIFSVMLLLFYYKGERADVED